MGKILTAALLLLGLGSSAYGSGVDREFSWLSSQIPEFSSLTTERAVDADTSVPLLSDLDSKIPLFLARNVSEFSYSAPPSPVNISSPIVAAYCYQYLALRHLSSQPLGLRDEYSSSRQACEQLSSSSFNHFTNKWFNQKTVHSDSIADLTIPLSVTNELAYHVNDSGDAVYSIPNYLLSWNASVKEGDVSTVTILVNGGFMKQFQAQFVKNSPASLVDSNKAFFSYFDAFMLPSFNSRNDALDWVMPSQAKTETSSKTQNTNVSAQVLLTSLVLSITSLMSGLSFLDHIPVLTSIGEFTGDTFGSGLNVDSIGLSRMFTLALLLSTLPSLLKFVFNILGVSFSISSEFVLGESKSSQSKKSSNSVSVSTSNKKRKSPHSKRNE